MRRAFVLSVLLMTVALALLTPMAQNARGQTVPIAKLSVTVIAGQADRLIFEPEEILIPQVPIIVNVTVINNGTTGFHTFSINDDNNDLQIDVVVTNVGDRGYVEFQVNESESVPGALGFIYYNGTEFTPEAGGGGFRFYCRPHRDLGMVGAIVLASGEAPVVEKGFFLRAYWIGLIALGVMLAWIGITYFVIKASSRHFTDHHEHIRRGLP